MCSQPQVVSAVIVPDTFIVSGLSQVGTTPVSIGMDVSMPES